MMGDREPAPNLAAEVAALHNPDLGQTMIFDPGLGFDEMAARLSGLGFQCEPVPAMMPSLLEGEPSSAAFSFGGARPFLDYRFNPVARLRVLEMATAPPLMRQRIARAMPQLTLGALRQNLGAALDRDVLRAIWGLVELEDVSATEAIAALAAHPSGPVAQEAVLAAERLRSVNAARVKVLGGMRMAALAARDMIRAIATDSQALLARPEDAAELFTEDIANVIAASLKAVPLVLPDRLPAAPDDVAAITAAPAGLLRWDNMLSRPFPTGYRTVAGWMKPDRVWVTWRGSDLRGQSGPDTLWDGLVFLGNRWVWFPRPFRQIAAHLGTAWAEPLSP